MVVGWETPGWVAHVLHIAASEAEADELVERLRTAGLLAKSTSDSTPFAQDLHLTLPGIKVLVASGQYLEAYEVYSEWWQEVWDGSQDAYAMPWTCGSCGESHGPAMSACWSCGGTRSGQRGWEVQDAVEYDDNDEPHDAVAEAVWEREAATQADSAEARSRRVDGVLLTLLGLALLVWVVVSFITGEHEMRAPLALLGIFVLWIVSRVIRHRRRAP